VDTSQGGNFASVIDDMIGTPVLNRLAVT